MTNGLKINNKTLKTCAKCHCDQPIEAFITGCNVCKLCKVLRAVREMHEAANKPPAYEKILDPEEKREKHRIRNRDYMRKSRAKKRIKDGKQDTKNKG